MSVFEELFELATQKQELDILMDEKNISEEALLDAIEQHEYDLKAEGAKLMDLQEDMQMRSAKADAIAKVYYAEYKKYKDEAKRQENRRNKLMGMIKKAMKAMGEKIIPAGNREFFLRKNGGKASVVIDDPSRIPLECCKKPEPDNDKIRAYLESLPEDIVCRFAHLERGETVQIRAGK